jgi:hypothetical protein
MMTGIEVDLNSLITTYNVHSLMVEVSVLVGVPPLIFSWPHGLRLKQLHLSRIHISTCYGHLQYYSSSSRYVFDVNCTTEQCSVTQSTPICEKQNVKYWYSR